MKVLILVEHYAPYIGGAEELWGSLAKSLVSKGHAVRVLTTRHDKSLPLIEQREGVEVYRLPIGNRFAFTFLSWRAAVHHLRWADFVQTSSYNAALPARMAALWVNKPSVITFHEVWGKLWFKVSGISWVERILYWFFEQLILKLRFQYFVAVSDFTAQALIGSGIPQSRVIKIYNGLDNKELGNYSYTPPEDFTFCYFGRPGVSKGVDWILPAFKKARDLYPQIQLKMIVSQNPVCAYQRLRQQGEHLKLGESVCWHHNLSKEELYREVSGSSAVLIPSLSEGFCYTAAEAVALGVPILSSDKGALPEVVGGKVISIKPLGTEGVALAMEKAIKGEWEIREKKVFPLKETVAHYIELYNIMLL